MDTSSSSSFSSSPNASSSIFGSFDLEADANPSFPYTPSLSGRRWRPRFFCKSISTGGDAHHFLDTCFLCKKPIAAGDDIFMYRGDAPFCSEECREEQMEMDEALENNRNKFSSSSMRNSSSSSASSTIKHKPSLIIRQNSRNVHAMVAGC
ncbi:uncharacterized protein [Elaeis guineensis]|uniref:Uncharacterized protein LOC105055036 n=2 Tax=Elaeis guineensis var. tenera TaxID=51953 RepID=A0A6I9S0I3_ELAGV|nr:uncharacterized protein LOC105055036 [Elaeis guineensis]